MPLFEAEDRTEPATPRKRQEAREQGRVARSQDLSTALMLLATCIALHFLGMPALRILAAEVTHGFQALEPTRLDIPGVVQAGGASLLLAAEILVPLTIILLLVGFLANAVQVGFLMSGHTVAPDPSRLNPVKGLERLLSLRGFFRGAFGLLKMAVVGSVLTYTLWSEVSNPREPGMAILLTGTMLQSASYALQVAVTMCLRASVAILVLAILDYGFQRWVFERDLRMTKSELKEELRRMEGDPRMKERRRKVQQQIAYQRMMRDVPGASVVVTNPTHIAVAIRYDESEMAAPRVVAKGEGYIAQRIREVAMENGVPVVERRELARALYGAVEIGQEIPPQFYKAVAELLAYVYRLTGSRAPGGFGRPEEMVGGRR